MLNIRKVIRPWQEAGSLNANVNLYGFVAEGVFMTKTGDLGMTLRCGGVDHESLDSSEQQYAVRRLESAMKAFGEGFHVYQYLLKTNCPEIPFARYGDEVIDTAIDQRREYFEAKRDRLYKIEIVYAVMLEGARSKTGLLAALKRFPSDGEGAMREIKALFSSNGTKVLLRKQIEADMQSLRSRVENFIRHLADFCFSQREFTCRKMLGQQPNLPGVEPIELSDLLNGLSWHFHLDVVTDNIPFGKELPQLSQGKSAYRLAIGTFTV